MSQLLSALGAHSEHNRRHAAACVRRPAPGACAIPLAIRRKQYTITFYRSHTQFGKSNHRARHAHRLQRMPALNCHIDRGACERACVRAHMRAAHPIQYARNFTSAVPPPAPPQATPFPPAPQHTRDARPKTFTVLFPEHAHTHIEYAPLSIKMFCFLSSWWVSG